MNHMRPIYDNDGQILYFESEHPKSTTGEGAKSPYFRGGAFKDGAPVNTPETRQKPITRPDW